MAEAAAVEDASDAVSSEAEPPTDAEAEAADGEPPVMPEVTGSTDGSARESGQEEPDPLADVFTSEDLDVLLSGLALSRDKAMRLLVHFATASLLGEFLLSRALTAPFRNSRALLVVLSGMW
jgi:hypothetical protein